MNAKHILAFRRKREGRTNYKRRLALLKSGVPRLVVRRTNKYILLQLVHYNPDGDKVVCSATSKELISHGWKGSAKSLPASYLTGALLAQKASAKKIKKVIADIGLQTHRAGTKLYAAVKGAQDAGLDVPARAEVFPADDRIQGKHLADKGAQFTAIAKKLNVSPTTEMKEN